MFVGTPHTLPFKLFEWSTVFEGVFVCAPIHVLIRSENMSGTQLKQNEVAWFCLEQEVLVFLSLQSEHYTLTAHKAISCFCPYNESQWGPMMIWTLLTFIL